MFKLVKLTLTIFLLTIISTVHSVSYNIGKKATPKEITGWDIDIRPDGRGLPNGSGSVKAGEKLYENKCAVCHGSFGEGEGRWPALSGGEDTLTYQDERPEKTIASYWPFTSTIWDYVHRAMPYTQPQSLTDDEVYAIVAYILNLNDLVDDDFILTNNNFNTIKLPNETGFIRYEFPDTKNVDCMKNCVNLSQLKVTNSLKGVTPIEHLKEKSQNTPLDKQAKQKTEKKSTTAQIDPQIISNGKAVYTTNCAACHQANGQGLQPAFPALAGNIILDTENFTKIILEGKEGTAMVSFAYLSDQDISNLVNFARQTWGDKAIFKKITASTVKAMR